MIDIYYKGIKIALIDTHNIDNTAKMVNIFPGHKFHLLFLCQGMYIR